MSYFWVCFLKGADIYHLRGRQLVRLGCNAAQRTDQIRRLLLDAMFRGRKM